ncbi:MAG: sodium:proton antiporter [Bdellovibrio sp. CG12_big_fil_rev_8_21_14_0_65_39_13]|nr:MAG: sodium:proton antiporter [Bdellovibrio sp. CG22_combo_CG10-13_8_21_14_all_39_27]PIQ59821.1 MAG: sodium:proton antiporter [Bdellovibrio sp. CG12_big_fil_rev_8_21_14_0_65_39_13]PIR36151.1 MAG: sodium:proton antiporter [Bdellovibrio sp. CG11_big_fil_rev_8_21_14_0_20_39_38]PJB53818.1 MAG: sodium:proton antiporter [Bdellovibrio sp. CG_4_9_14_3_um_filter_39_7]
MTDMKPGLESIKHVIAIASGKGGVGKSTVTTNLAIALAKRGLKVGVMDGDIYGPSQPGMFGAGQPPKGHNGAIIPSEKYGVKYISMGTMNPQGGAVIMRAPLAVRAINQFLGGVIWGELDYLLIDLPPGTGDIQLTLAQSARLSGAVIVTTPQRVAVDIAKKGLEMFRTLNVPILGIIENMSGFTCPHCHEKSEIFKHGGGHDLAKTLEVPFLGEVPLDPIIMMSGDDGKPVLEINESSIPASAFKALALKIERDIGKLQSTSTQEEPKKIEISAQGELVLTWESQEKSILDPFSLRLSCPCASCVDENTGKRIIQPSMIKIDIKVIEAGVIGRYGLSLKYSDGHGTGIYKYTKLKELKNQPREEINV